MKALDRLIGRQIRKPSGFPGRLLGRMMAEKHKPLVEWMIDSLHIRPTDHVLDVGCGGGMTLKTLAGIASDGFVVGIDHSPIMVKQAIHLNTPDIKNGHVAVHLGDVGHLPFDDASFDMVCGVETFYFWPEPARGLKEVLRVLKSEGVIALVMDISKSSPDSPEPEEVGRRMNFHVYSGEEMTSLLTEAGFTDVVFKSKPDLGKGWLCAYGVKPAPGAAGA